MSHPELNTQYIETKDWRIALPQPAAELMGVYSDREIGAMIRAIKETFRGKIFVMLPISKETGGIDTNHTAVFIKNN